MTAAPGYDVLVMGEVLVELSTPQPLRAARELALSFSGDALNAAAAAAAAGATVGLLARIASDELGDAIVDRVTELGIDPAPIRRGAGYNGTYFVSHAPGAQREFVYARRGSAGSTLGPHDVEETAGLASSTVLVVSGITQALSASCVAAVDRAVAIVHQAGGGIVYDPNFRGRLTTPHDARQALARVAPFATLVTPSCPADSVALLDADDPVQAACACLALGASAAAVTCGEDGVVFADGRRELVVAGVPAAQIVDTTGAGDVLAGTVAARLALGDDIEDALGLAVAAASLSLAGPGGAGAIPTLAQTRAAPR